MENLFHCHTLCSTYTRAHAWPPMMAKTTTAFIHITHKLNQFPYAQRATNERTNEWKKKQPSTNQRTNERTKDSHPLCTKHTQYERKWCEFIARLRSLVSSEWKKRKSSKSVAQCGEMEERVRCVCYRVKRESRVKKTHWIRREKYMYSTSNPHKCKILPERSLTHANCG